MTPAGSLAKPSRLSAKSSVLLLAVAFGLAARIAVAWRGHNYDVDSYFIVLQIVHHGGTVYKETTRYNYGPAWFFILDVLSWLARRFSASFFAFRLTITLFLSAVDLGLFMLVRRGFGTRPALLFFLSPIAIVITGYHSQFDNLALLIGLLGVFALERRSASMPAALIPYVLLGLSLVVKQDLVLFPIWLMFRKDGLSTRITALVLPLGIFAASFLPYLGSLHEIEHNVFFYRSSDNVPLLTLFGLTGRATVPIGTLLFVIGILLLGWSLRERSVTTCLFVYLLALVALSPSLANQYLAIPLIAIAIYWNLPFALYTVIGTYFLLRDVAGLHYRFLPAVLGDNRSDYYASLCLCLIAGTALIISRHSSGHADPSRRAQGVDDDSLVIA